MDGGIRMGVLQDKEYLQIILIRIRSILEELGTLYSTICRFAGFGSTLRERKPALCVENFFNVEVFFDVDHHIWCA
jgi:hypothetical protein